MATRKGDKPARDRRRFPVGQDPRRERRRAEAIARDELRRMRSSTEQLKLLDARPGSSARERAKLEEEL